MTEQPFVHLHVHTEFSLLDGFSRIPKLVSRAAELGMKSLAITDHGVMFGVIDFYRAAKKAGIKPIIGMEGYITAPNRRMTDRDSKIDGRPHHLLMLAQNEAGYKNLLKIASASQLQGYYYRPRIDNEFLAAHSEGLIVTSGCLAAQIPSLIAEGRDDAARDLIDWYVQVFGKENFYLELQEHQIDLLRTVNTWLIENGRRDDVQFVATNDVHYVMDDDYDPHDTLLCIQTSALKGEQNRMRMTDNSYFLSSAEQMWNAFGHVDNGSPLLNTVKIAEMVELDLDRKGYHLPAFAVPEGHDASSYVRALAEKGMYWRYGSHADDADLRERLNYELGIISKMGFDTYFLIVWDLCEYARHADIWWNVRGSGAGSIVAYCMGITNIDPIENHLLFERFLNPGRVSMPDIDLDYPDDRRAEMISYAARKYGEDKVAAIITFGTLGAKAAVRDVGRALNVDLALVNQAARLIPTEPHPKPVHTYVEENPELQTMYNTIPEIKQIVDTAASLQGISRHASTHAAGIIIADQPLEEYVPLHRMTKGGAEKSERIDKTDEDSGGDITLRQVTQFPMETCESIGLLKVDFLGLSTLTYMRRACDLIARHHGIRYDMSNIPYRPGDSAEQNRMLKETFEMLGRGETVGVFQLESSGMQGMLRDMRPTRFEHIVAGISLYRPGPMDYIPTFNKRMHGEEPVVYHHEKLRPILEETFGIMVYQEQIMRVGRELFGYTLGDADLMRKAVSKKKKEDLLRHRDIFLRNGPEHGVNEDQAAKIFDDIEFFANYGFNRAHASDYAVMTCQSAFLKCHYPAEYMAALLTVYFDDAPKVTTFLIECKRLNIPILPPDINHSQLDFDIQTQADGLRGIRFGLAAIKNAGVGALQHIIAERDTRGEFASLQDFCERLDLRLVGRRTVESLIKVGALESLGDRRQLANALDRLMSFSADRHKAKEIGQVSLFGEADTGAADDLLRNLPSAGTVSQREMLNWEKELLGLYVSYHPIDPVLDQLRGSNITNTLELKSEDTPQDKPVRFVGLIAALRRIPTRSRDMMCVATLEDRFGTIDVVLFPRTWNLFADVMQEGMVVVVSGKFDRSRNDPQIICESVTNRIETITSDTAPLAALAALNAADNEPPPWNEPPLYGEAAPVNSLPQNAQPSPQPEDRHAADDASGDEPPSFDELPPLAFDDDLPPFHAEKREESRAPQKLRIRFHRNGDQARDRRRLERVVGIVTQHHGHDRFEIIIVDDQIETYLLEFPNHTTNFCPKLLGELGEIKGIEVDAVSGVSQAER